MTLDEAVALLRQAQGWIGYWPLYRPEIGAEILKTRIDAALAAHEAEERVEWTPLADGVSCASEVDGCLVEVRPARDGWWGWKAEQPVKHRDRQHGHKRTKELAQEAAVTAARGMK